MAQALPWLMAIQTAANIAQTVTQPRPQPPPVLSWDEAMERAQQTLNPVYDQMLQDTLRQVDLSNIRRGFFGQAPGAAMSADAASRLESQRASQIAQLANQMVGQSAAQAAQLQALAQSQLQQRQQSLLGTAGVLSGLAETWPTLFSVPNIFGTLQSGATARQNRPGMTTSPAPVTSTTFTTPAEARLTPNIASTGIANRINPYAMQINTYRPGGFVNPYR